MMGMIVGGELLPTVLKEGFARREGGGRLSKDKSAGMSFSQLHSQQNNNVVYVFFSDWSRSYL